MNPKEKQNRKANHIDTEASLKELDELISVNPNKVQLYLLRADAYFQKNELAKAINDYEKVLQCEPENREAKARKEMIQTILKYNNTDIYASPNTNMDPWFE